MEYSCQKGRKGRKQAGGGEREEGREMMQKEQKAATVSRLAKAADRKRWRGREEKGGKEEDELSILTTLTN